MADAGQKTAVVTGGTDGIGRAVALELAKLGWQVAIVGRSAEKGAATLAKLRELSPREHLFLPRDFSKLQDAASAGEELSQRLKTVHALVHCAGIISSDVEKTSDGIERNFVVNYLSRFLLTRKLAERIPEDGRVVIVAAAGFFGDALDFERLAKERIAAPDEKVFETSQYSNDLWAVELAERQPRWGVWVVNPGLVNTSIRQRAKSPHWYFRLQEPLTRLFGYTPTRAARTPVYLATAPGLLAKSGTFFGGSKNQKSVPAPTRNPERRAKLWSLSEELIRPFLDTALPSSASGR